MSNIERREIMADYSNIELLERDTCYIICNHSIYYRVGKEEGSLLVNLKNGLPLEEIAEQMAISVNDLKLILKSFEERGIINILQNEKQSFFFRIPLFSPDAFLGSVVDQVRDNKYIAFFAFLLSNFLILLGTSSFLAVWKEIFTTNILKLKIREYVLLFILFSLTIALHELAHGLACRYFGCTVGKMGLRLILLVPFAYCDINSIRISLDKKWQIITYLSGIYVHLFALSIASILFYTTVQLPVMAVFILLNLFNIVVNLIPFTRLDGYWIFRLCKDPK
jgi:putative peptide zinc metalloprotease protein